VLRVGAVEEGGMMDNFRLDITTEGPESLRTSIALFGTRGATHYSIVDASVRTVTHEHPEPAATSIVHPEAATLVTFWTAPKDWPHEINRFPLMKVSAALLADFIWAWLVEQDKARADYADLDGSLGKSGFRIWSGDHNGRIGSRWEGLFAVRPHWAWFHK
jgi:hypothetical protein